MAQYLQIVLEALDSGADGRGFDTRVKHHS